VTVLARQSGEAGSGDDRSVVAFLPQPASPILEPALPPSHCFLMYACSRNSGTRNTTTVAIPGASWLFVADPGDLRLEVADRPGRVGFPATSSPRSGSSGPQRRVRSRPRSTGLLSPRDQRPGEEHRRGPESDFLVARVLVRLAGSGFFRRPQPCVQLVAPVADLARLAHHGAPSLPGVVVLSVRFCPDIRRAVDPVVLGSGVRSASCSSRRIRPATASLVIGGSA